jgi:type IV pilus assembly protein PilQ
MISLRAFAVAAFAISASALHMSPSASAPKAPEAEATVMSLIVKPDSQRVDVVVGVRGDVSVKDFVLRGPDKIVVDISNATLGMRAQSYDHASRGGIVNVHYAQNKPNVVRVVVTLDSPRPYRLSRDADGIRISVMGATSDLPAWVAGYQNARMASVTPKPAIPREVQRTVERANAAGISAPGAMTMNVNGKTVAVPQQQSQERRITINFENLPILEVLKIFSEYSGRSIVPSNKVVGSISASIADVPWDVALQALLNLNGFDAVENQFGMITVDTFDNLNTKAASQPLTTQTLSFNYTSASAVADILRSRLSRECPASMIPNPQTGPAVNAVTDPTTGVATPTVAQAQPIITTGNCPVRGAIIFDTLTNSVHITDIAGNVDALVQYARTLDRRQPQVNIKAKIILVDRTQLDALGVRYDLGSQTQFFNSIVPRNDSAGNPLTTTGQIALGGNTIAAVANATARIPNAALQLVYSTAFGAFDFTTFFEALQSTSLLDVQAEPNGTVLNNQTLTLQAGTDVPIRTSEPGAGANAAGQVATVTVQTRTTGVILQVTPRVTNDGRIQMKVHIENSSVTFSGADAIAFPKQSVDNVIMIADGATWVIGGLTQTSVTSTRSGIPLLMDLPILGGLFGVTSRQETKRDLLILITPHIVDPGQDAGR